MKRFALRHTNTVLLCLTVLVCLGVGRVKVVPVEPFVDTARFERAQRLAMDTTDPKRCQSIRGAMVNHHALASDLLWKLFQRVKVCRPNLKRIIVLSPDHFFQGQTTITTWNVSYRLGRKIQRTDSAFVDALIGARIATANPQLFQREHGVGALMPFVMNLLPEGEIIPIVIRSDITKFEAERLSVFLKTRIDDQTFLIVSSDMSHYLLERTALHNDRATLHALETGDTSFFWTAKDGYTDFGKGIWIALKTLAPKEFQVVGRGISSQYGGSRTNTTSYITGVWK